MGDHDDRKPCPGLLPGAWDRLVGPGATRPENVGMAATTILGAAIGLAGGPPARNWGPLRRGAAALMGADLFGGVWASATPAATRWYHGRGQGTREMVAFSALHLHPFLVAAFYRDRDWGFALGNYAYLLAVAAATAATPAPLWRAAALALCCGGAWLNTAAWRLTPGMGWFPGIFFLKLLASHASGRAPTEGSLVDSSPSVSSVESGPSERLAGHAGSRPIHSVLDRSSRNG